MSSISFWAQDQAALASRAATNDQLDAINRSGAKLFSGPPASTTGPTNVLAAATTTSNSIVNGFGLISLNFAMNSAVLAAQEGSNRVNKQTANLNTSLTRPAGDLSSQVTFQGSLGVNFGAAGPAMGGAYHFLSGSDLQTAFTAAFGSKKSEGEAVDTVSVLGNTMTGSTSGANAHDVFKLTLNPNSGLYTFQLLAPIDQSTKKGSFNKIFLQGLMQATSANGQKMLMPSIEMDVYNDYGAVQSQGNWALLHEGSLTYQAPNGLATTSSTSSSSSTTSSSTASTASKKTAYKAPINPLTGYSYTTSTSAGLGVINSLNIFS